MRKLTKRKRILRTFQHQQVDKLVFSPRLYYWYGANGLMGRPNTDEGCSSCIPKMFLKRSEGQILDYFDASPRYVQESYFLPLICPIWDFKDKISVWYESEKSTGQSIFYFRTPKGVLRQVSSNGHLQEYPIKTLEDMEIMKYILNHTRVIFLYPTYLIARAMVGDRGVLATYFFRSPYMKLIVDFMGFTNTIVFLKRYPREMAEFMQFLEQWDDHMYENLAKSPLKILNFGENIDANLSPPPYFEKYLIPYYEKRVKEMHRYGKICTIHMDGSLKDLLPYLESLPFDGLEALTAKPQGDVTLEEIKKAIGDKIYLDGIPSVLFLPQYSLSDIKKYTKKVLEMFSPNLILGISDEMPPNGDIRKVAVIARMLQEFEP
ncbi:MAG: hypothetical protein GF364_11050 [Candidatus Lokiarchaeota archaeon]|nr:hypothetical protein [Candidatus Lokiarchaeota archaeon]